MPNFIFFFDIYQIWYRNCNQNCSRNINRVEFRVSTLTHVLFNCAFNSAVEALIMALQTFTRHLFSITIQQDTHSELIGTECRIYASVNYTNIGSDNGLSPSRRQAINWTNAWISLIAPLDMNFTEMIIEILHFHLGKCIWKYRLEKWRPFCLSVNELTWCTVLYEHIVCTASTTR